MELKRNIIITVFLAVESRPPINLKLKHMNVSQIFVYRIMKHYKDTDSIAKHNNGGSNRTVLSPEMDRKLR